MKKKIWIRLGILLVLVAGFAVRFCIVNHDVDVPEVLTYEKGEEVPLEKDFFYYSSEDMEGYSIQVLDSALYSVDEFLKEYHAEDIAEYMGDFTDYIYTVRLKVSNHGNEQVGEKGIALTRCYLKGVDYILSLEEACYQAANPDMPGSSFSIRNGTSIEVVATYEVLDRLTSKKHILAHPPKLMISLYPHQKLLEIVE